MSTYQTISRPVSMAAFKMGVLPEQCLMVGDTTVDMMAGKNAGTQTAAVLCGFGEKLDIVNRKFVIHPFTMWLCV